MNSEKIIHVLVIVVAMLTGSVAYLFVRINYLAKTVSLGIAANEQTAAKISDPEVGQEIAEELKPDPVKSESISISSEGFVPSGIQVFSGQTLELSVINDDTTAHSFNIDELNIKTGSIEPGKTMPVTIDNLPANSVVYQYYSDIDGDKESGKFTGMLMILKK